MGTPEIDLNALAAGLDPAQVSEVADFIGYLRAKRERQALPPLLADAPLDDEPTTPENLAAIEAALSEPGRASLEQVKAELGL